MLAGDRTFLSIMLIIVLITTFGCISWETPQYWFILIPTCIVTLYVVSRE